jgi:two-component system, OmpR family, response regulator AdeR
MSPRKILIIEDDRSFARLLEIILTGRGFKAHLCLDPRSAIEMAMRVEPDLIILNIHMPRRSGTAVLKRLRQEISTSEIPVIVSSSMTSQKGIERLKKLGVNDFVSKSSEPDVLLEIVMSYLAFE